ncbi:MAG: hypothetical protein IJA48_01075, partial [Oscillospiraceae bacterium]|nr:hypothetical protein [Oscillospiraceae bacterium]
SPTWESVPLNVSIIWEFDIKQRFLGIRIATATGGLAMTLRNLIAYSWPENPPNTGAFGCAKLFGKFLFDGGAVAACPVGSESKKR